MITSLTGSTESSLIYALGDRYQATHIVERNTANSQCYA